jgi:ATP-dependent RNA helicase DDX10/DBP4
MMPNKDCFDVAQLPLPEFAQSLGLGMQPSLKFLEKVEDEHQAEEAREENRSKKNVNKKLEQLKQKIKEEKERKKRLREGKSDDSVVAKSKSTDNLLVVKAHHSAEDVLSDDDDVVLPRAKKSKPTKQRIDVNGGEEEVRLNMKVRFGEDGITPAQVLGTKKLERASSVVQSLEEVEDQNSKFIAAVKERLAATSELDKEESKAKLRDKKNKKKWGKDDEGGGGGAVAILGSAASDDDDDESGDDDDDDDDDNSDVSDDDDDDNSASMSDDEEDDEPKYAPKKAKASSFNVKETEEAVMRMLAQKK